MCLYPKLMLNKRYVQNKKNQGNVPECTDNRKRVVPVGCGKCMECLKQKARWWQVRLTEEIRHNNTGKFVTLTFSNAEYEKLAEQKYEKNNYKVDYKVAKKAVRRFTERWRQEHGKTVRHWLITEKGQTETERLHLHGIIFTEQAKEEITKQWKYGYTYIGTYVSDRTANYITKYLTKRDELHKDFIPKIYTSQGMGAQYITRKDAQRNKYTPGETNTTYITRNNTKLDLPTYYRNKLYTEEEREKLWMDRLDKQERYVDGLRIDVSTQEGWDRYYERLKVSRAKNKRLGYQDIQWNETEYMKGIQEMQKKYKKQGGVARKRAGLSGVRGTPSNP